MQRLLHMRTSMYIDAGGVWTWERNLWSRQLPPPAASPCRIQQAHNLVGRVATDWHERGAHRIATTSVEVVCMTCIDQVVWQTSKCSTKQ